MADQLKVSTSAYYRWLQEPKSKRALYYERLDNLITKIFWDHKARYGSVRITQDLKVFHGINAKRQTVAARMETLNLIAKARRKFKATTDSSHNKPVADNLLQQDFLALAPNQKWVTDITYIATQQGWLYLCVVIDLYSRKVIGWWP